MKQDIFFYMQLIMFSLNVVVFIFLMRERKVKYRFARVLLILVVSIGFFINLGKVSWFAVLLCLTPFISLLKIKNERLDKFTQRVGDNISGRGKPLPFMEGHRKAAHR